MKKILFVCHGNICRSPMAEFIMKDIAAKAGRAHEFHIESAAASDEEIGNPVYPPARRVLAKHGIDCAGKRARKITPADFEKFDLVVAMDNSNLRNIGRICAGGSAKLLMEYAGVAGGEVDDPWYTGDFDKAFSDISAGCSGLFESLS